MFSHNSNLSGNDCKCWFLVAYVTWLINLKNKFYLTPSAPSRQWHNFNLYDGWSRWWRRASHVNLHGLVLLLGDSYTRNKQQKLVIDSKTNLSSPVNYSIKTGSFTCRIRWWIVAMVFHDYRVEFQVGSPAKIYNYEIQMSNSLSAFQYVHNSRHRTRRCDKEPLLQPLFNQVVSYRSDNPRQSYFYLLCTHFFVGTWEDATCDDVRVAMNFLPEHVTYLCNSIQIIGTTRLTWFVDSLAKFLFGKKCIGNSCTLINEQE